MRLASFTRTLPQNVRVSINPINVVAVDTFGNFTRIFTTAADKEANASIIGVTESYDYVVSTIAAAMNS